MWTPVKPVLYFMEEYQLSEIKDELLSLSSDLGEVAIDSIMKDGILKDIPIVGTAFSVLKLGNTFCDRIMLLKICSFIKKLNIHTEEERRFFKEKYFKIKDYPRIGSKIILSLSSVDDEKKIAWLAKSFNLLLDLKINDQDFLRLSMIINNSFPEYMEQLIIFKDKSEIATNNKYIKSYILEHLYSIGMLTQKGIDGGVYDEKLEINDGFVFELSNFGKIFLNNILAI